MIKNGTEFATVPFLFKELLKRRLHLLKTKKIVVCVINHTKKI